MNRCFSRINTISFTSFETGEQWSVVYPDTATRSEVVNAIWKHFTRADSNMRLAQAIAMLDCYHSGVLDD